MRIGREINIDQGKVIEPYFLKAWDGEERRNKVKGTSQRELGRTELRLSQKRTNPTSNLKERDRQFSFSGRILS